MAGVRGSDKTPGDFRTIQNWVGTAGSPIELAEYVPPPVEPMQAALGSLERFLHDKGPMPSLIKVGLVHAQFETIHPFLDGNGRIGRLLITFLLCEQEILRRPLLYLSHYFKAHRTEYYDRLQAVRDRGAWEEWLRFFLQGIIEVSQEASETARGIISLREAHRALVNSQFGRGSQRAMQLLESLYFRPVVSVRQVADATQLGFPNANALVSKFQAMGLLQEITGRKRDRRFYYTAYLDLLNR